MPRGKQPENYQPVFPEIVVTAVSPDSVEIDVAEESNRHRAAGLCQSCPARQRGIHIVVTDGTSTYRGNFKCSGVPSLLEQELELDDFDDYEPIDKPTKKLGNGILPYGGKFSDTRGQARTIRSGGLPEEYDSVVRDEVPCQMEPFGVTAAYVPPPRSRFPRNK